MDKGRAEAFSDGVLAVAITLLALDLRVDTTRGHTPLGSQLREHWPTFAAYFVSFFLIGVVWINHHALFALAARVDRVVLAYNLILLLSVTTIPFTTSTLADFLREGGPDARFAVLLYGISMEGMAIGFTLILNRMLSKGLTIAPVGAADGKRAVRRFGLGLVVYPIAVLIGLWSPPIMLIFYACLTAYYMLEQTPILPNTEGAVTPVAGATPKGS